MKKFDVKRMCIDAAFSAIAVVLYCFLKFKIPTLFPSFLEFNFSMLPIIILLFTFGATDGIIAAIIRMIGKLIFVGTGTSYVGELADLLIAILVCLATAGAYQIAGRKIKNEVKRSAIAMGFAVLSWIVSAVILNWIVLVPAYIELFFHGSKAPLIGMCKCIPGINQNNYMPMYLFLGVVPFNFCLSVVICLVTYVLHLRTYKIFSQEKVSVADIEEVKNDKEE